jgi:glucosamine kinase
MNMIIEAGGTKSNIVFTDNGKIIDSYTEDGFNLNREPKEEFEKRLIRWSEFKNDDPAIVYLFVAGKPTAGVHRQLLELMKNILHCEQAFIHSDLLAACYATAGNTSGIVAILGTGSNSCYYNGTEIKKNISPGGFILGDEGSGAHIGKTILLGFLRNELPLSLKKEMEKEFHLTNELIIQNVYGGSVRSAALFCSSFASFVISRLDNEYCLSICSASIDAFLSLIQKNYLEYSNQLCLVGSVAYHLGDLIKIKARQRNIEIIKIIQHPIQELSLFLADKKIHE